MYPRSQQPLEQGRWWFSCVSLLDGVDSMVGLSWSSSPVMMTSSMSPRNAMSGIAVSLQGLSGLVEYAHLWPPRAIPHGVGIAERTCHHHHPLHHPGPLP